MITPGDLYNVLAALVPLYVAVALAYAAVRWGRLFTPEQCAGINRFAASFAVPLLNFQFISAIDLSRVDLPFAAADTLSKLLVLAALFAWTGCSAAVKKEEERLEWCITFFSLATLPNTLLMGVPLLAAMYGGGEAEGLVVEAVALQSIVWFTVLIALFEYRAARDAIRAAAAAAPQEEEVVQLLIADDDDKPVCSTLAVCENPHKDKGNSRANKIEGSKPVAEAKKNIAEPPSMSSGTIALISRMVWSKLMKNPNFYASVGGLCWVLISASSGVKQPLMMEKSVTILSNCALGVAMFSLGNFMALQPRFVACGNKMAMCGLFMRFFAGPAVMALSSLIVGIQGKALKVSIIQAALPQAVVPFVFAREYNVHGDVLSTAVIFGMIVSLPVTIAYYVFLELIIPNGGLGGISASNLCNMPSSTRPLDCYLWQNINHITNATVLQSS